MLILYGNGISTIKTFVKTIDEVKMREIRHKPYFKFYWKMNYSNGKGNLCKIGHNEHMKQL